MQVQFGGDVPPIPAVGFWQKVDWEYAKFPRLIPEHSMQDALVAATPFFSRRVVQRCHYRRQQSILQQVPLLY